MSLALVVAYAKGIFGMCFKHLVADVDDMYALVVEDASREGKLLEVVANTELVIFTFGLGTGTAVAVVV